MAFELSKETENRFAPLHDRLKQEAYATNNPVYCRVSKPELKEFLQLTCLLFYAYRSLYNEVTTPNEG